MGVFRNNHLVALRQLLKQGHGRFPGTNEPILPPEGSQWAELHDALLHGVETDVWSHQDVSDNAEAFKALMATDNFDAAWALAEDEFGILGRLSGVGRSIQPRAGETLWRAVYNSVRPFLGNRWSEKDLLCIYGFVATADPEKVRFLRAFSRFHG